MRVLFAAMQWDYGLEERGPSFEMTNLCDALRRMENVEVRTFDFMAAHAAGGHSLVAKRLRALTEEWKPQLLFTVLFRDEVPPDILVELRDRPGIITFNWFCDDHWRFEDFTSRYAPLFNACSTTAPSALRKYAKLGVDSVIKTQWGCNHHVYRPSRRPERFDVTFVGMRHGNRRQVIDDLRSRNLAVEVWGWGWESGRLNQAEMIATFSESRINLNLSNASVPGRHRWWRGRKWMDQIKGRNFEIPGCRGFQLSGKAQDLESYFEPGREIVTFENVDDLHEKIERYLRDDKQRQAIAEAGYRRTVSEHTYEHRFKAIFDRLGLS